MKLLSADDMREFITKENQQPRRIKVTLTIKDLGVEVSPERKQKQFETCLFKSPTVPDAIKKFILTKRKAARLV